MNAHPHPEDFHGAALRPLRPYQQHALEELRRTLMAGASRVIVQMATGAGKTLLAAHIVRGALSKGKSVAFVVPVLSLVDQTVAAFEAEGIHAVGVMQGFHERTDARQPVQVCSAQTLARRKKPNVDLIIVDEAHVMHKSVLKWMDGPALERVPFVGLSATPWSKGLGKHYTHVIIGATTAGLINDGFLSKFVAYAPSEPDLSRVSTVAGDFKQDELGEVMDVPQITGDIIATWLERGENRPTIAFCVNRKHAQHICERFVEAKVAAEYLDGMTERQDREVIFDRFRAGETRILCNVGVLTTGIDLDVRCLIDAQPTKSRILFVQKIGRGLRTAPGKDKLIILDHGGTCIRLGLPTDIHQDHLDDGTERAGSSKAERGEPKVRVCKSCKACLPRGAMACTACGEPVLAVATVRVQDGDLVELGSRRSGKREPGEWEKQLFYSELKGLKKPTFKSGWVAYQFRERFGHWPPRDYEGLPEISPSLATINWHKSRLIAYAKRSAG
jgi:DNA repair protein RadD